MKPVGHSLGGLHICDEPPDQSASDEDGFHESEESEEDYREEQEEIDNAKFFRDELKGCAFSCSTSSPASEELISAIKGSREKRGGSPGELRVTWAPDVYEPGPTNLEDIVTSDTKQQKVPKKEKTTAKESQKGKDSSRRGSSSSKDSTRASGRKDKKKKQTHRANGRSSKSFGYADDGGLDDY